MGGIKGNVVAAEVSNLGCSETIRCQELFHRKMRKLNYFRLFIFDDGDQGGTSGKNCVFSILRSPSFHQARHRIWVKFDCEYLCEFFNTEWPDSCNQTLEKSMCMMPFLFRNFLQCPF